MDITGFIIGTAVVWILTDGVVVPLARSFAGSEITTLDAIDDIPTGTFIVFHFLVLGIAGLLLGLIAGIYFIGFASKAKMWPGMIALMVASLFGSGM